MIRTIMLIPMLAALLACALISSNDDPTEEPERSVEVLVDVPVVHYDDPTEEPERSVEVLVEVPAVHYDDPTEEPERTVEVLVEVPAVHYGDALIEEKILEKNAIVKARMTSLSSEVVVDVEGKFRSALKFGLDVSEYLKGSGPSSIVAVWVDGRRYDTREDVDAGEAYNLARRDDQWDDKEAIIFLYDGASGLGTSLDARLQLADHFFLALGHMYFDDDRYSLHSDRRKVWLPAVMSTRSTDDGQEFLLDVPSASGTAPTITLGELKTRIAEVAAELDGSDPFLETCVREKYELTRVFRYFREEEGKDGYDKSPQNSSLASGQPAGTELHERQNGGGYPDKKGKTWLEGRDAALFSVVQGDPEPFDYDEDGRFIAGKDTIVYTETFATTRPLPDGEYQIDRKEVSSRYIICNFVRSHDWTITVTAPEGVLHEAFFDPVTDGTAVAADGANGVLKPRTFTGDASATIERIAWDSGTATLKVVPHSSVTGHAIDFIELDGTVSLSLNVDEATVDTANDTLTWPVASQPWHDGDKLMVRIRSVATPMPVVEPIPTLTPVSVPPPTRSPEFSYLTEEIPPCTPISGSLVDPCEPRGERDESTKSDGLMLVDAPLDVDYLLNSSPATPAYATHIVLRGTFIPGTVRCTSGHSNRYPSFVGHQFYGLLIYCFVDVRVNAYLLGSGPSVLTVIPKFSLYQAIHGGDDEDYGLEQLESRRIAHERALSEGGRFEYDEPLHEGYLGLSGLSTTGPPGGIGGREVVMFIMPLSNLSVEAWEVYKTWDLERRDDGTVVAIHPFSKALEMELPTLLQEVTTAHQARVARNGGRIGADESLPMFETDANRLRQYFSDPKVGGYAPGVPTPAQPPAPCGLVVPDQGANPGLMRDCMALLSFKDSLWGTASLNWGVDLSIADWDGVTVEGTPMRVTRLRLPERGLDGEIPSELSNLSNLESLWLSGNYFTSCILSDLESIADNDLDRIGIQYCTAP